MIALGRMVLHYRRCLPRSPIRASWPTRPSCCLRQAAPTDAETHEKRLSRLSATPGRQSVDYTTLCASIDELQSWIPSRVEQVCRSTEEGPKAMHSDVQIVQWHPQCVALRLRNADDRTWMYLSWHPTAARVHCGEPPPRGSAAEEYTFGASLHKRLQGHVLKTASMPVAFERVVHLTFSESLDAETKHALWCEVMGKYSNLILTNEEGEIELCAHQVGTKLSSLRQLQVGRSYESVPLLLTCILHTACFRIPPLQSGLPPDRITSKEEFYETLQGASNDPALKGDRFVAAWREKCRVYEGSLVSILVHCFQGMSPCLARDMLTKASIDVDVSFPELEFDRFEQFFAVYQDWLHRIKAMQFEPTLSREDNRYSLVGMPGVWFSSVHGLLDIYYRSVERDVGSSHLIRSLRTVLKRTLTRLAGKKKKLLKSLDDAEQAEATQKKGDLIIANLHNYVPGMSTITVEDWETGASVDIPLNPLKNAVECAQSHYKRAKKMRRARESVQPLLDQLEQEMQYIQEVEESVRELDESDDEEDAEALAEVQEELIQGGYMKPPPDHHLAAKASKKASKRKPPNAKPADPDGLRLFTSPNGFRILIGRNNRQNDLLSKTKGKTGDLWFHARGVPGAHVLLKLDGKSDPPEKQDIQCAAELAAYYSKARAGGKVTVSMTGAENVTKPRGAPPGLVQITKERSLQVRPSDSLAYKTDDG